jgi:hypothetical protein
MRATNPHPDVPAPAGALSIADWHHDHDYIAARHFRGTKRGAAEIRRGHLICVDITGDQFADGTSTAASTSATPTAWTWPVRGLSPPKARDDCADCQRHDRRCVAGLPCLGFGLDNIPHRRRWQDDSDV